MYHLLFRLYKTFNYDFITTTQICLCFESICIFLEVSAILNLVAILDLISINLKHF